MAFHASLSLKQLGRNNKAIVLYYRFKCTESPCLLSDFLLSEERKEHVLQCMKKVPATKTGFSNAFEPSRAYAAVLIALCTKPKEKCVSILYTRRSAQLSRHNRQVAFPGGLRDHSDNDYIDCALRETEEEIGLPRSSVEIWGTGSLVTPSHTAAIMPVFGVIRDFDISKLKLNEHEVEDAFTVRLKDLIAPESLRYTQFKSGHSAPLFLVKPYRIWGITAFITNMFLHCLLPSDVFRNRVKFVKPYRAQKNNDENRSK